MWEAWDVHPSALNFEALNNAADIVFEGGDPGTTFIFTSTQQLPAGDVITATDTRGVQAVANGPSYPRSTSPFSSGFTIS